MTVFMIARSRLPLWILPLFRPLSVIAARMMRHPMSLRVRRGLLAWVIVLVFMKGIGVTYMPPQKDSRALAEALREMASFPVKEVVFIDASPLYGLSLYLDCEVERVSIGAPGTRDDSTLGWEVFEKEQNAVFLVEAHDVPRMEGGSQSAGHSMRSLGKYRNYHVLVFAARSDSNPHEI